MLDCAPGKPVSMPGDVVSELGMAQVPCIIVEEDDIHAELAMIDENLMRADLDPAQRAKQTARRKAIYVELHPETAHGAIGGGHDQSRQLGDSAKSERFTADTAASTGKSERVVQRDAERGENIAPDVLDTIAGTKALNTGVYLDKLKNIDDHDAQRAKVERDIANDEKRKASEARARRASRVDADVVNRAAREVAEAIVEHVPGHLLDGVKANLYAAKAVNVANALTNLLGQSIIDRSAA